MPFNVELSLSVMMNNIISVLIYKINWIFENLRNSSNRIYVQEMNIKVNNSVGQ